MDLILFPNELPRDEHDGLWRRLYLHAKSPRHAHLADFLQRSLLAFRDEVGRLSSADRVQVPHIESIAQLRDHVHLRKGRLGGAVDGVMLIVLELGSFIRYCDQNPDVYGVDARGGCLAGLGIGLLAAAAVSISPTVAHLPAAGAAAVRCAFRLGILVDDVSQNLEARSLDGPQESWAYVVTGATETEVQKELDHLNHGTPGPGKLFVSASNAKSITVSGPPSRLKWAFRESNVLRYAKYAALPVFSGLCHAPHVYTRNHAREILDTASIHELDETHQPARPVLSTESGDPLESSSSCRLWEDVTFDILARSIHLDRITAGVIHTLVASPARLTVLTFTASKQSFAEIYAELDKALIHVVNADVLSWTTVPETEETASRTMQPIAIVGMACRFPGGGDDLDSFWELLENGRDVHTRIPPDRFDVDSHYDPTGKRTNSTPTPYGCFINEPGLFDAPFFNISAREALETDPMHRLALVTAYEALERAGYVPNRTPASDVKQTGVFYGQASDDYREVNTAQNIGTYFIPGGCRAFAPGRISYYFGFWGPSVSCDTACSSSLATIQLACTSLWAGDADTIVAGGLNILTNSDAFAGLGRGHFLSPTGNCKTWDSGADGYCRADGVGSVVLKRLDDAEADNDNILGVILAAATNHSAEAVSITHPHAGAQAELFTKVVNRAGVDPLDVNYVEFHGTGTQAGDSTEMESVLNVFAPGTRRRAPSQPLYIGAVKSNVGHGEASAGVTALIKVLCMLQRDTIPPHIGVKGTMNPVLPRDLKQTRNVHIPFEKRCWSQVAQGRKRLAVINNFSAAGGNTTILLEEGPRRRRPVEHDTRETHAIVVSAKSRTSLRANIQSLISYLEHNSDVSLADLSYTTCARRIHHPLRVAMATSNHDELRRLLTKSLDSVEGIPPVNSRATAPVAFAFAGQGSMYIGAGKALYHDFPAFAAEIQQYNYLCQLHGFPEIIKIIDGSAEDGSVTPVASTLAIVCIEMALSGFWKLLGVQPSIVIGHSLGEYAALHAAGVLSASDVVYLVGTRAELLSQTCTQGSHAMLVVRACTEQIQQYLPDHDLSVEYACRNSTVETVLAGEVAGITALRQRLEEQGYKCHELSVPFAFHSAQMDPILDEYEARAKRVIFKAPNIPVISPTLSNVVFDPKTFNARYLRDATRNSVQFMAALHMAEKLQLVDPSTVWVDIGAHPLCGNFIKNSFPSASIVASSLNRKENDWKTLANSCALLHSAGIPINWSEYHRPFETGLQLLDLPKYQWNNKTYWIQYKGTWALTKGNDSGPAVAPPDAKSPLHTSSVHRVVHEDIQKPWNGSLVIESDVVQPDFLEAAWGHKMNNCAVVTSSIHADLAFTIGQYLHDRLEATGACHMNITKLEVLQGLVANSNTTVPQPFHVKASTDLRQSSTTLHWYNAGEENHFASAVVEYGDQDAWLAEWDRVAHLVTSRIATLEQMGNDGRASKLSRNMAYRLFANLVDYADKYRGMQSVIICELEAVANVRLTEVSGGIWTIPPHFIDSVCHLAGFIMNGGDASETRDYFYVTPGWESMRFAGPLVPGGAYRSYVKMRPTTPGHWVGDVYILQGDRIMGMVGGILFRRFPRSLLGTMFSPRDKQARPPAVATGVEQPRVMPSEQPRQPTYEPLSTESSSDSSTDGFGDPPSSLSHGLLLPRRTHAAVATPQLSPSTATSRSSDSVVSRALAIIAREAAIEDAAELADDCSFVDLGIDSLLSLVLSEKFREELDVGLSATQFLECPTIGEFKVWLGHHC